MTTVTINGDTRHIAEAEPQWITTTINELRRNGLVVCVQVNIQADGCHLNLQSPGCGPQSGGGGGRPPNDKECGAIDLWRKHGLVGDEFTGGNLQAFLAQIRQFL